MATAILSLASGGLGGKRAGCVALTAARYECSKAILSQTLEETRLCATGDCDRQTQKLRSGKETGDEERRASTA